jgi:hypothetical protein
VNSQTTRQNVHFLQGSSGTQFEVGDKMHVPQQVLALGLIFWFTGTTSLKSVCLFHRDLLLLGGQHEISGRLSGLIEE